MGVSNKHEKRIRTARLLIPGYGAPAAGIALTALECRKVGPSKVADCFQIGTENFNPIILRSWSVTDFQKIELRKISRKSSEISHQ